jgi:hypothetical protein
VSDTILFSVRIPVDLRDRLVALAEREGRTIQRQAAMVLALGLDQTSLACCPRDQAHHNL